MGKLQYAAVKSKAQAFLSLTSLTVQEFEWLVPSFEQAFQAHMSEWRLDGKRRTQRRYTTYQNCPLPSAEERLLFVISYVKNNPIQSQHGLQFGLPQGKTNQWLHVLLPVLRRTFQELGVAPARSLEALASRLDIVLPLANEVQLGADAPFPLFVTMEPNEPSHAPKMQLHRQRAIAARKERIR
jgi:hypothetical protein